MATLFLTIGLIGVFFIFMSVRLIFLKDGKFKGTCASQSPFLNKDGEACGLCGKLPDDCDTPNNPDNEVDKVLGSF